MDMVEYMNLTIITVDFAPPYHIIVLAKYEAYFSCFAIHKTQNQLRVSIKKGY